MDASNYRNYFGLMEKTMDHVIRYEDGIIKIEVNVSDKTIWLNQKQIGELFEKDKRTISEHITNILNEGELDKSVVRKFRTTGKDGKSYDVEHYNLDMVISVGYRVSSKVATKFRQWATKVLNGYLTKGFVVDEERMKQKEYFEELLTKVRKIRTSEKGIYEKVRDIFKETSTDYSPNSKLAKTFYATAQNKFHYAITQKTAAEIIVDRCNYNMPNIGMTVTSDVNKSNAEVAKNYMTEEELDGLINISEQFLIFADSKAKRKQVMTMEKWVTKLNQLLEFNEYPVLYGKGSVSHSHAKNHAHRQVILYKSIATTKQEQKQDMD